MASSGRPRTTCAVCASRPHAPARSRSPPGSSGRCTSMSIGRALVLVVAALAGIADAQESPEALERPKLLEDAPPRYPEAAWKTQKEADVVVLLTVAEDGSVSEA